ncbi:unnamed protein product, partial [Lota lota]
MDEARPSCSYHLDVQEDIKASMESGGGEAAEVRSMQKSRAVRKRRQLSSSESDVEDASQPLPNVNLAQPLPDSSEEEEAEVGHTNDKPTVVRNLNFENDKE